MLHIWMPKKYSKAFLITKVDSLEKLMIASDWLVSAESHQGQILFDFAISSQRSRTDLNKRFLPRPNTITAWKLIPHRSKISKNWNPPCTVGFQILIFTNTKTALQQLHANSFYLVKKFPMCRILILADIRPMGYKLSCCGSIWSG